MAERSLAVSLIIGGALSPTLARAFRSAQRTGVRSGQSIVDAMKRAKLGEQLAGDVIKYKTTLEQLRAKQAVLGTSSTRLAKGIADVEQRYRTAKQQAKAYGITIANVASEHRQLAQAARLAERRIARSEALQRNRDARSQIKGQIVDVAAPALLLAKPLKEAIQFESVLADINKVVDFKKPDGLLRMGDAILKLSTDERIPMAAAGLGDIVAAAGQAGIKRKELVQFARDAAKIGVAFDLSGKEAGSAMTGLRNIFSLNQREAVLVADSYNHLSNNMDATAAGILRVTTRAGSLGKLIGFTGQQVGALGATFLALKTPPEVAATGINALMTRLATANKQPPKFAEGLRSIGLSASELKADMERDAQGTLIKFLEAVAGSEDRIGVLADLFGAEYADDIAKLVGSLDTYKKALSLIASETNFAGSAQKEYEARAATTANDLKILANQGTRLAIVTGRLLLPSLKIVATQFGKLADFATLVSERFPTLTKVVGVTTVSLVALKIAALGGRFAGTLFSDAWLLARGTLDALRPSVLRNTAAMLKLRAASLLGAGGLSGLATRAIPVLIAAMQGLTLASLFNPVGLAVAAIVGGAFLIVKFWKPIKAFMTGVWQGIQDAIGPPGSSLRLVIEALTTTTQFWIGVIRSLVAPVDSSKESLAGFAGAGRAVGQAIGAVIVVLKAFLNPLNTIQTRIDAIIKLVQGASLFSSGKSLLSTFADGIEASQGTVIGKITGVLKTVKSYLPQSDAKVGPLSQLTASGRALVTTLGTGIKQAGSNAISGPLFDVLSGPIGPLGGLSLAGAAAAGGPGGGIHIDMSGMTIHGNTPADAQGIGEALEARIRRVMADLSRSGQTARRGALHDGDSAGLGSL